MLVNEEWISCMSRRNLFHRRERDLLSEKAVLEACGWWSDFSLLRSLSHSVGRLVTFRPFPLISWSAQDTLVGNTSSRKLTLLHRCRVALGFSVIAQLYVAIMELTGETSSRGQSAPVSHTQAAFRNGMDRGSHE